MPQDTTAPTRQLDCNPFRLLQLAQRGVPLDRDSDRAIVLARAFCVAREADEVFAALRMARFWTVDATGALDAACFASYIASLDHGMTGEEFDALRELAYEFRDSAEA
jgi:hypothetical protein